MRLFRATLVLLTVTFAAGAAQAQQCLHDENETAAEKDRRTLALNVVRLINTSQIYYHQQNGRWGTWEELVKSSALKAVGARGLRTTYEAMSLLRNTDVIPGFQLKLTTDGETYSLMLRDYKDPCKFSFYSDQDGVVYYGQPIDMPPSASLFKPE